MRNLLNKGINFDIIPEDEEPCCVSCEFYDHETGECKMTKEIIIDPTLINNCKNFRS
jgi:hypothetical protein